MTLPKTFTLASQEFNNFETTSFEAGGNPISTTNELQQQAQNQQQQQLVQAAHTQRSTMSLIQNSNILEHNTMFDATSPPQIPTTAAAAVAADNTNFDLMFENVMPGIYLTKNFISLERDQLRSHGFTHVIIIDKHIQELYYPNQQPDIFKLCRTNYTAAPRRNDNDTTHVAGAEGIHDDSSSINAAFDYYCTAPATVLNFGKEFEVIDLNFGEKSYLTTVLPNCYKAVKFINKALQSAGTILVIDCNGGEQKCLTIIVAYLMYKHNISFSNAFARLKEFYKKADLDRFYISQLYEYEPILQVQRAQSRGHSCSRELHAAILKRKKPHDDESSVLLDNNHSTTCSSSSSPAITYSTYTNASALLNNCNPLNRFDTTQMERPPEIKATERSGVMGNCNKTATTTFTRFMSGATTGGWYNWDDYAME